MSDASRMDALWTPIVQNGLGWCAPNAHADAAWLDVGAARWRIAVTHAMRENCYVVSATGQYLDYARDEIRRLPSRRQRVLSDMALGALAPSLRRLDPVVILDALPLSTVLHVARTDDAWRAALETARATFPGLPIVVRSLNATTDAAAIDVLRRCGMRLVISRLVFVQDPRAAEFWRIRNVRNDLALASRSPMESRPLTVADVPRITALYWMLYGEKHSRLNPRFTSHWLAHAVHAGALAGHGIVHQGDLVAAYLCCRANDVMTNPVFGYDIALPRSLALYRRLSVLTMLAARADAVQLHASSGAPGFKASRGGVATLEYHAVDLRTVRGVRRAAWESTIALVNRVAPRVLRNAG